MSDTPTMSRKPRRKDITYMRESRAALTVADANPTPAARTGRPPRPFKQADADAIIAHIESGMDMQTAFDAASVSRQVANRWLVENESFALAFKKAQSNHIKSCLSRLRELPAGRWQAAAWELERIYPERFGAGLKPSPDATVKLEVSAQVCNAMSESWKMFSMQVVAKQQPSELSTHNIGCVSSDLKQDPNPTGAGTSELSDAGAKESNAGGSV